MNIFWKFHVDPKKIDIDMSVVPKESENCIFAVGDQDYLNTNEPIDILEILQAYLI